LQSRGQILEIRCHEEQRVIKADFVLILINQTLIIISKLDKEIFMRLNNVILAIEYNL
jgi:hypothetical protein